MDNQKQWSATRLGRFLPIGIQQQPLVFDLHGRGSDGAHLKQSEHDES